ncbi:FtsX-like permease family protein [Cohnella candidum]|uniref:ABC transporter permease n=1 Tax=Cohnella candidum TaxID=2674991 RepID=A0A3G3JX75_9BACL|nr:ABC transporter permease [Cohnella candidum]AYQ72451.1 ABC transporter permease [Cohnella candidum]
MMLSIWVKGLLRRRIGRLAGTMAGVALTVALLSSLGSFISDSNARMTQKAIHSLPVDWQILLAPGANNQTIQNAVSGTTPYTEMYPVGYADVASFTAVTGGTTQTTGAGKVLGLPKDPTHFMQAEVRPLLGGTQGVLIAQQTAANLHVTVGDTVRIERISAAPAEVKIDGVIDLPEADSLFQAVGAAPSASPQAPPDNVLVLPNAVYHQIFDPQAETRPDTVTTQVHVKIAHPLPSDPNAAFAEAMQMANHVEAEIAGSGTVGNNLAARLDGVREDALYARTVFLFLGLPGAVLGVLLTVAITASGSARRRQEQALLRTRGASMRQVLALHGTEALIITIGGIAAGILFAVITSKLIAAIPLAWNATTIIWLAIASFVGFMLSVYSVVYPAWMEARRSTVASLRTSVGRQRKPLWRLLCLDWILLAVAGLFYWRAANTGYELVLAPEGVIKTSVHYEQFIAPLGLWIGGALLLLRLWSIILEQGGGKLSFLFRPIAGGLSHVVSGSLSRQKALVAKGTILIALAFSFAVSTSVFNMTYNGQARVDAELTNGSDVNVTGTTAAPPDSKLAELGMIPGVKGIQSMEHRFAFVGNDLQDIYGIDPRHIGEVSTMSDFYFGNGNAKATLDELANTPDGVLVSQETISDFQLKTGDRINLRLQNAIDHQYHVIPFHLVGMVKEFPTAPKDSFLVANSSYIAKQTGSDAAEVVLIRTNGSPVQAAKQAADISSPLTGVSVTEIGSVEKTISSSLTSISLRGLSDLEILYAVLIAVGFTGLILALGLTERRRTFAIISALGGTKKQVGSFLWSEGLFMLIGGAISGIVLGFGIAYLFVKILTGVFDPPPEAMAVPWIYFIELLIASAVSTVIAIIGLRRIAERQLVQTLRNTNLFF